MSIGKSSFGWYLLALCSIAVSLVLSSQSTVLADAESSTANATSPLGANLHPIADWTTEYTFKDAFKSSRPWMTQAPGIWDSKEQHKLDLDANGYPRSLPAYDDGSTQFRWVGTIMFNGINGRYPGGEYIVLYEGEGTIEYGLDAAKDYEASQPGRDVLNVTPGKTSAGISLVIKATDPFNTGDYIRNIRVMMPGYENSATQFHPTFLSNIENYKVLRFMDWMRTNWDYNETGPIRAADAVETEWTHPLYDAETNPYLRTAADLDQRSAFDLIDWSDRTRPTDATYASENGVPAEVMIDLANTVDADPWFNMPHLASDDYITGFAQLTKNRLEGNRHVYIEYSNEVWNSGFGQAQWIERQAKEMWPHASNSALEKRLSWFGMRTVEMCNIWKTVYGADADKVICVMATQGANTWIGKQNLECPLATEIAPCHQYIDAVAIAPYFGQHIGNAVNEATLMQWTQLWDGGLTKLFNELQYGSQLQGSWISKTSLKEAKQYITNYVALANSYDLDLIAYEGGQHLVGVGSTLWNQEIAKLFANANRDPRMAALYQEYFEHWTSAGGQMFTVFSSSGLYSQWGNWGIREYADEMTTAKQSAVDTFIAQNPCTWDACKDPEDNSEPFVATHFVYVPIVVRK